MKVLKSEKSIIFEISHYFSQRVGSMLLTFLGNIPRTSRGNHVFAEDAG